MCANAKTTHFCQICWKIWYVCYTVPPVYIAFCFGYTGHLPIFQLLTNMQQLLSSEFDFAVDSWAYSILITSCCKCFTWNNVEPYSSSIFHPSLTLFENRKRDPDKSRFRVLPLVLWSRPLSLFTRHPGHITKQSRCTANILTKCSCTMPIIVRDIYSKYGCVQFGKLVL